MGLQDHMTISNIISIIISLLSPGAWDDQSSTHSPGRYDKDSEIVVNTALMAHIEQKLASKPKPCLRISHDVKLVLLYMGFISYMVLISFYKFLGPAVDELCYWGGRKETAKR